MQKIDDDATITQLTQIWVQIAAGGEQVNDALSTLQDLSNKYGTTGYIFNLQGICCLNLRRFQEAEKFFQQALEKNSNDSDSLSNLITCHQHQGKPSDVISREISQLRTLSSNSTLTKQLQKAEDDFERYAKQLSL